MRWIAIFTDKPGALQVREAQSAAHFAYLEKHREQIRLAGGVRDAPGGLPDGALVRLCEEDPYFTSGLRQSYVLKAWGFAPCYADVTF
jgi:uncharacterized protein